jgi:hypothetical protein
MCRRGCGRSRIARSPRSRTAWTPPAFSSGRGSSRTYTAAKIGLQLGHADAGVIFHRKIGVLAAMAAGFLVGGSAGARPVPLDPLVKT